MTHLRIPGAACALALAAVLLPVSAVAQSALASRGLGYPLDPIDARARALGGATTGFGDPRLSLVNPAALAGMPATAIGFTFLGDRFDAAEPGTEAGGTARFPLIQVAFPVYERAVLSVGYGAFLDQNWRAERRDSMVIGDESREVIDRFSSSGGPARLRLGAAYQVNPRLGLGVGVDVFAGALRDSVSRTISGGTYFPSQDVTEYRYQALGVSAGARWTPSAALTVAGAVSGGGEMRALPRDEDAAEATFSLPLRVDAGVSGRVTQNTALVLAGRWTGWSTLEGASGELAPRDVAGASLGMEYDGFRMAGRRFPLRVGGRYDQLPFAWAPTTGEAGFTAERAVTAGFGAFLAGGAAQLDVAGERGWRDGSGVAFDEPYWRISLSVLVLSR
jgi:hypothetical protein